MEGNKGVIFGGGYFFWKGWEMESFHACDSYVSRSPSLKKRGGGDIKQFRVEFCGNGSFLGGVGWRC